LAELPKKEGNLSSLTIVNLNGCSSLVALPKEVGNLSSLTTFKLGGCPNFVAFPQEVENLSSLPILTFCGIKAPVGQLPFSIRRLIILYFTKYYDFITYDCDDIYLIGKRTLKAFRICILGK